MLFGWRMGGAAVGNPSRLLSRLQPWAGKTPLHDLNQFATLISCSERNMNV
jgi:hypothetical protein